MKEMHSADELPQASLQLEQQLEQRLMWSSSSVCGSCGSAPAANGAGGANRLIEIHNVKITALELKPVVPTFRPAAAGAGECRGAAPRHLRGSAVAAGAGKQRHDLP